MTLLDGVFEAVIDGVLVLDGVPEGVPDLVGVVVLEDVFEGLLDGVPDLVGVFVLLGVPVGVLERVPLVVLVGVNVWLGVILVVDVCVGDEPAENEPVCVPLGVPDPVELLVGVLLGVPEDVLEGVTERVLVRLPDIVFEEVILAVFVGVRDLVGVPDFDDVPLLVVVTVGVFVEVID